MKIDRIINRISEVIFGLSPDLRPKLYMHSQNLNEDRNGEPKGLPWHGRSWFNWNDKQFMRFEWNLWNDSLGVSIGTDDEDRGLKFHIAFPPVSLWLTVRPPESWRVTKPFNTFEFDFAEVRFFDKAIWWKFWHGEDFRARGRPSRWRQGCFHPIDYIFGNMKYSHVNLKKHEVMIPMPEGSYPATIQFQECTWKRPRFLWNSSKGIYADVKLKLGIPHEGKGESGYDCGEDAVMGLSRKVSTVEAAIAATVECALKDRRRYNGNVMAKYPTPVIDDNIKPAPTDEASVPSV